MLTELFLNVINSVFAFLFSFIPPFPETWNSQIGEVSRDFFQIMSQVSYFLPLNHIIATTLLSLAIANFSLLLYITNWIIRRVADIIP